MSSTPSSTPPVSLGSADLRYPEIATATCSERTIDQSPTDRRRQSVEADSMRWTLAPSVLQIVILPRASSSDAAISMEMSDDSNAARLSGIR